MLHLLTLRFPILWISAALGMALPAAAQRTWIVDQAGSPDSDFRSVAPAIAAAAPGDVILIRRGTYQEPQLDIDKGLSLIGEGRPVLDIPGFGSPAIAVHDLPAGQAVGIRGLAFDGTLTTPKVLGQRCAGLVLVQDISGALDNFGLPIAIPLQFEDCAQVDAGNFFARLGRITLLRSSGTLHDLLSEEEMIGIRLTDSDVTLDRCRVTPNAGSIFGALPLFATRSTVRLSRTELRATTRIGAVPAIEADQATLWIDPTTSLHPYGATPAISGTATVVHEELATLAHRFAGPELRLDLHLPTGSTFLMFLSFPAAVTPTPLGALWIDTQDFVPIASGATTGRQQFLPFDTTGIPAGALAICQAAAFDGTLRLTNGTGVLFR